MNQNQSFDSEKFRPQILYSIPNNLDISENLLAGQFIFAFPNGIEMSYTEKHPKVYSVILTNQKGIQYYLYILLFYDKVSEIDSKTSINNNNNDPSSEGVYFPISIIIKSYYSNIDFFRNLLLEFFKIIKFDSILLSNNIKNSENNNENNNENINSTNNEKIKIYQKLELLNYMHFCYQILRPPNDSIFSLNLRFNIIEYKFNSLKEKPSNDFCIEVLFNVLEISVIIKLFIALLFEKQIIIISNQNLPLFCICESLKLLLFPFRWLHSYIPNLPCEQISFLESPTPYLMGINSSSINLQELMNNYPSHIICDSTTSTLYGNVSNLKLPFNEENKMKTKLLLLNSKFKNNYDDIELGKYFDNNNVSNRSSFFNDSFYNEDKDSDKIDFKLSFAKNVQNTFFSIFKNNLVDIKKEYMTGNVFNSRKFINSFLEEDYKLFFEKIINTIAFEDFILSMQYLDDSFSRQFNLMSNYNKQKVKINFKNNKYFNY